MVQKIVVPVLLLVALLVSACSSNAPATTTAETSNTTAQAAAPTEAPAVEAAPTEAPAVEAPAVEGATAEGDAAQYVVDTASSTVEWFGSKPIGSSETGTVKITEGALNFTGEQLVDGTIVIDMTSIASTSLSGGMAERIVGHLTSDDFFGVATYPKSTLVLKSAEPTAVANQYKVMADLTIKSTTKEIEFMVTVAVADGTLTGNAEILVNRADFDVRYGSGTFFTDLGDDLISDEMKLTVVLVAKQA